MKCNKVSHLAVAVLLRFFCARRHRCPGFRQRRPPYSMLVLEPGHSQTLLFELDCARFRQIRSDLCLLCSDDRRRHTECAGRHSLLRGAGRGVVYAVAGLVNTPPVFKYAYNAETISYSAEVPAFGIGIFFAAIGTAPAPDYPIVMSMVFP